MAKRSFVVLAVTLLAAIAIAVPRTFADHVEVVVHMNSLRNAHITINRGDHVIWRNASMVRTHVAFTAPDGPQFLIEGTAEVTFEKPGTYEYYIHQPPAHILHGTVTVK
jgi:plastocyanin